MSAFDPKRTCSHGAKSRISLGLSITLTPGGDVQRRGGNGRPGKRRRRTNRPKARKALSTHATIADLQGQLDGRTRERDEALEQWAATTEVLKVISHSTFDLQTVLASVVGSAGRLCRAENVQIFLRDGEVYRLVADNGFSPEYQQYAREHPIRPGSKHARGANGTRGQDDLYPGCIRRSRIHLWGSKTWRIPYDAWGSADPRWKLHWRHSSDALKGASIHRYPDRTRNQFRRAGRHRHREHAAAR